MSYAGILSSDGALITIRPAVCRKGGCGHTVDPGSEWCPQHQGDVHALQAWANQHTGRCAQPGGAVQGHGTDASYHNRCRCDACRAGHAKKCGRQARST